MSVILQPERDPVITAVNAFQSRGVVVAPAGSGETHPVRSSNVAEIGYDAAARELHVVFRNGQRFAYLNVTPDLYDDLERASSIGGFIAARIKPTHEAVRLEDPDV